MIRLRNQVPQVYSNASRDFQYLGWLIDIVLNSVKHNVDDLQILPKNTADPKLTELLAITLGFKIKRSYDQKQLAALASIIPQILKYKGTKKAITLAGEALLTASGDTGSFDCTFDECVAKVVLPKGLIDTTLFMDLLPYILPAGMTCKIIRKTELDENMRTDLHIVDTAKAQWHQDRILSVLYSAPSSPTFANFDQDTINTGLLSNNVIPTLSTESQQEEEIN